MLTRPSRCLCVVLAADALTAYSPFAPRTSAPPLRAGAMTSVTHDQGSPVPNDDLDWNQTLHEMMAPITVVTGHTQLLQRQILRADGLANLERDLMLGNVAAVLVAMQTLTGRVEAWVAEREPSPGSSPLA